MSFGRRIDEVRRQLYRIPISPARGVQPVRQQYCPIFIVGTFTATCIPQFYRHVLLRGHVHRHLYPVDNTRRQQANDRTLDVLFSGISMCLLRHLSAICPLFVQYLSV